MPSLLVMIPAYNEEGNIGRVIREIGHDVSNCSILVLNDGSTDGTAQEARDQGAAVISLPFNMGIGACVQTGFKIAERLGYEFAIQVDGDGQHVAGEVATLLSPLLRDEADVVIGSRYMNSSGYRGPIARRIGSAFFSAFISAVSGQRFTDATSGFRAYNQKALAFLARHYPSDYPEVEAALALVRQGFKVVEVPVRMRARGHGRSSITAVRAAYYMVKVLLALTVALVRKPPRGAT